MASENKKEEKILLTETEVWDVIKFARSLYGYSYLSPSLINARMKDINLNPREATDNLLEQAMKNPKSNEGLLREFSQNFELTSMVYKRLLQYLSNMLAFDITYICDVDTEKNEYNKPRYKSDTKIVEKFLDKFDYKKEFRIVIREMLRNDAYFGLFRDLGDKYILQELPPDYCKITGRWSRGFLFSFNMDWFDQAGVDINMYPPFFKKKLNEINKKRKTSTYKPSIYPEKRGRVFWNNWVDIPTDIGVCFKLSPELVTKLPYFVPLFSDLILQPLMRKLQKNTNMAAASKIIMGEVPLLNKEIKATVRDSFAISPDLLGKFLYIVKAAISDAIKVGAVPLNNIRSMDFKGDNNLYDSYIRTALATSGINTNLIFSSSIKPNAIETQLSLDVDEQMMEAIYPQFDDFMDYFINKKTKHFEFYFVFEGTEFSTNRKKRFDTAMALFNQGIILEQKIAASLGMKPHHLRRHLERAKETKFMELLMPPSVETQKQLQEFMPQQLYPGQQPQQTTENEKKDKGRPKKDISEISEEGAQTRATGANIGRGGDIDKVAD